MTFDSYSETMKHLTLVQKAMDTIISNLEDRRSEHDLSKFESPEKEGIDKFRPILRLIGYGNPGYNEVKFAAWGEHHYAVNDHHMEHYTNGIRGMTLGALVEQFCDYVASVQTSEGGDFVKSVEKNREKLGDEIADIYLNTFRELFDVEH